MKKMPKTGFSIYDETGGMALLLYAISEQQI